MPKWLIYASVAMLMFAGWTLVATPLFDKGLLSPNMVQILTSVGLP